MALHGNMMLAPAGGGYSGYQIANSMVLDKDSSQRLTYDAPSFTDPSDVWVSLYFRRFGPFDNRNENLISINNGVGLMIGFNNNAAQDKLQVTINNYGLRTTRLFRDPGSWYHVVFHFSGSDSKIYVNGVEETDFAVDERSNWPSTLSIDNETWSLGAQSNGSSYFNGAISDFHFVVGSVAAGVDAFGEFWSGNPDSWTPKAVTGLSYGEGSYLDFSNGADLGEDQAGSNDWTENGSPVQSSDSPTVNYATLNPFQHADPGSGTLSNGNLKLNASSSGNYDDAAAATIHPAYGKWYWEITCESGYIAQFVGVMAANSSDLHPGLSQYIGYGTADPNGAYYCADGKKYQNNVSAAYGNTWTTNDVIGVALDLDNGAIWFSKNGTWQNSATASEIEAGTTTNAAYTGLSGPLAPIIIDQGNSTALSINFGQSAFSNSAPTGFVALSSANLPAISDSDLYFNGGSADLVWIKSRSAATSHKLIDTVRGVGLNLSSDIPAAETGEATVNRIDKYGIHLGDDADVNNASATYVAWMWKAGDSTSTNTDGSITSTVSVNDDAGFSIVRYTANETTGASVGHGMTGGTPEMIILKNRDNAQHWQVYHHLMSSDPETDYLSLNRTDGVTDNNSRWNDTAPDGSVFTLGNASATNRNGDDYIAYCFRSIPGYSKVFSYRSNNVSDGPFIWFGFKPAFVMLKRSNTTGDWPIIWASSDNVIGPHVTANESSAERTTDVIDFLSNGIKLRTGTGDYNGGTNDYIGIAFAENPFGGSNLPLGLAQ